MKEGVNALKTGLKLFTSKPITYRFPPETPLTEGFRGRHIFNLKKCRTCGLCSNVCPSGAIEMIGKVLEAEINHYVDRCMFCGQCAEICPENAIRMSEEYELADFDRSKMLHEYKKHS